MPVLGNGDIWEADDALRMVARDRLRRRRRRPRLPGPAVAVRRPGGRVRRPAGRGVLPTLGEVAASCAGTPSCSSTLAAATSGDGCTDFRKHVAWYLKGFPVGGELRRALAMVVVAGRAGRPARQARPGGAVPGDRAGPAARPHELARARSSLPDGWLASRDDDTRPRGRRAGRPPAADRACRPRSRRRRPARSSHASDSSTTSAPKDP